jgi:hypothetical protein
MLGWLCCAHTCSCIMPRLVQVESNRGEVLVQLIRLCLYQIAKPTSKVVAIAVANAIQNT